MFYRLSSSILSGFPRNVLVPNYTPEETETVSAGLPKNTTQRSQPRLKPDCAIRSPAAERTNHKVHAHHNRAINRSPKLSETERKGASNEVNTLRRPVDTHRSDSVGLCVCFFRGGPRGRVQMVRTCPNLSSTR